MARKETTRSPSLTRTLDADTKAKGISNKTKVVEGIKTKDTRTMEVAVTKEEDSKVVAEATVKVAVSEEAVAVEINIIRTVGAIVALLQPIRPVSLIGTTIIITIT